MDSRPLLLFCYLTVLTLHYPLPYTQFPYYYCPLLPTLFPTLPYSYLFGGGLLYATLVPVIPYADPILISQFCPTHTLLYFGTGRRQATITITFTPLPVQLVTITYRQFPDRRTILFGELMSCLVLVLVSVIEPRHSVLGGFCS